MRSTPRHLILTAFGGALALGLSAAASATNFLEVYHEALTHDPTYQQAYANYMAAREARPEAWAALLPHITASAGKTWTHSSGSSGQIGSTSSGGFYTYNVSSSANSNAKLWSLDLSENLFSWTDWMNLKAANKQVAQAQANYQAAAQDLILRTATAYFNVLAAVDTLHAQESSLKALTLGLTQAKERFKVGLIAITDVEQARAARDTAAAAVITAKQTLANALDKLQVITGTEYASLTEPGQSLPLTMPHPASQSAWVQTSLKQNLNLIATRLAAAAGRDRKNTCGAR